MASGWSIILVGAGTVALPYSPEYISEENPVEIEDLGCDDGTSVSISKYKHPRLLTLEGFVTDVNAGSVETTYLSPLRLMAGKQVTITSPNSEYAGTWIMATPSFSTETGDIVCKYNYRLPFQLAGTHIINLT